MLILLRFSTFVIDVKAAEIVQGCASSIVAKGSGVTDAHSSSYLQWIMELAILCAFPGRGRSSVRTRTPGKKQTLCKVRICSDRLYADDLYLSRLTELLDMRHKQKKHDISHDLSSKKRVRTTRVSVVILTSLGPL